MINAIFKLPEQYNSDLLYQTLYDIYEIEDINYTINLMNKLFQDHLDKESIEIIFNADNPNNFLDYMENQECFIVELFYNAIVEQEGFMTVDGREDRIDYIRVNSLEELDKLYEDFKLTT